MSKRLGIIQTRGIGDIIIALPIADFYIARGWEVVWPVDVKFVEMFRRAKPDITFLPVEVPISQPLHFFINEPVRLLRDRECDKIMFLDRHFGGVNICNTRLAASLKFDEYKYAIAGVPFERKWMLEYERDLEREESLFESLDIKGEYVLVHDQGSTMDTPFDIPKQLTGGMQVVRASALTDSIFDWRLTIERAAKLIMVDSCFANFVEQLNLGSDKAVFLQWSVPFTPVYSNGWRFIFPSKPVD